MHTVIVSLGQLLNVSVSIDFTDSGTWTVSKELQFLNNSLGSSVTPSGITIEVIELQLANVLHPNFLTVLGSSSSLRLSQPLNAHCPIVSRSFGSSILTKR